jgi:hypothetical protein
VVQVLTRDQVARVAEELLKRPMVAQAFASALQRGMETKVALDRNVQTVLSLLNLPSRADFSRLLTKLEVIQGNLTNLSIKVDRLEAAQRQPAPRPPKKPAKKPRASRSR